MTTHSTDQPSNFPKPLQDWLCGWLSNRRIATDYQVKTLIGDGSPRSFFRILSGHSSWILMHDPKWVLSKDYPPHQAYLKDRGLAVPEFFAVDSSLGALLMQDLGNETLQDRLSKQSDKTQWLENAAELIAHVHGKTYPVPEHLPAATRRFDAAKFQQELEFTYTHFVRTLLKRSQEKVPAEAQALCAQLDALTPKVFCHRDYHTRNLMVHMEQLFLIDFQDARLGPIEYDVASLLFDPYSPLTDSKRSTLWQHYRDTLTQYPLGSEIDWDLAQTQLYAVALQRVVKAVGSFAYFFNHRGLRTHLPYILPALKIAHGIQAALGRKVFPLEDWTAQTRDWIAQTQEAES